MKLLTSTVLCNSKEQDCNLHLLMLFYTAPDQPEITKWRSATDLYYS